MFYRRLFPGNKILHSINQSSKRRMQITAIPANADNYMYLVVDEKNKLAAIVDPVDVNSILDTVRDKTVRLEAAFVTHHHWDHAGGTGALKKSTDSLKIYGGDQQRIEAIDIVLEDQQHFQLGSLKVTALKTPCHTSTHVCYYVVDESSNQRAVFTGDTLFIGGCGRFFEGTAKQMNQALNEKLGSLPDDTLVYCGHEYTVKNLQFALTIEPNNENIKKKLSWAEAERASGRYTVPSTIAEEKTYNPFMRVEVPTVQEKLHTNNDPIATMQKLRELKNNF